MTPPLPGDCSGQIQNAASRDFPKFTPPTDSAWAETHFFGPHGFCTDRSTYFLARADLLDGLRGRIFALAEYSMDCVGGFLRSQNIPWTAWADFCARRIFHGLRAQKFPRRLVDPSRTCTKGASPTRHALSPPAMLAPIDDSNATSDLAALDLSLIVGGGRLVSVRNRWPLLESSVKVLEICRRKNLSARNPPAQNF